jgi:uncharacterized membrane protein YqjE
MEASTVSLGQLTDTSKGVARQLLSIGENRLELLAVELMEEREHLLRSLLLLAGTAVSALLTLLTLSAGLVVLLWPHSPATILFVLSAFYLLVGVWLALRLRVRLTGWRSLSASLEQLRKDHTALKGALV